MHDVVFQLLRVLLSKRLYEARVSTWFLLLVFYLFACVFCDRSNAGSWLTFAEEARGVWRARRVLSLEARRSMTSGASRHLEDGSIVAHALYL